MLLGLVSPAGKLLLDAFLEYISNQERHLIKEVLLLGTAGKFTKPASAIFSVHSGIPKSHKDFWNKQSISSTQ